MLEYFRLQRTLLERQLVEWRLAPWLVYVLVPLLVLGGTHLLLRRSEHAVWLVVMSGLSVVERLSGPARNDFLRGLYRGSDYRKLRLMENGLIVFPLVVMLAIYALVLPSLSCGAGALVLGMVGMSGAWWIRRPRSGRALPTPFSREPFEFATGFRRFWWVFVLVVFVMAQGLRVGNYELCLFMSLVVALTGCQMVSQPEPGFFVWIHSLTAKAFLRRKILLGLKHQLILTLPTLLLVLAIFPQQWLTTLVVGLLGLAYLLLWMLVKYAVFPQEINVGHAFIIALGMVFFPALLILIPMYYQRALARVAIVLP